jgi:tripartite-type tricarboxylate transporter receptor subunit TctC
MKPRTLLTLFGVAACAQLAAPLALAQGYLSRPIKLIVPYETGAGTDTLVRQIGSRLQTVWG